MEPAQVAGPTCSTTTSTPSPSVRRLISLGQLASRVIDGFLRAQLQTEPAFGFAARGGVAPARRAGARSGSPPSRRRWRRPGRAPSPPEPVRRARACPRQSGTRAAPQPRPPGRVRPAAGKHVALGQHHVLGVEAVAVLTADLVVGRRWSMPSSPGARRRCSSPAPAPRADRVSRLSLPRRRPRSRRSRRSRGCAGTRP
jgi:hypothetical protein